MKTNDLRARSRKQKGVALLLCIFALLLITGIALAMLATSDTETTISKNYREQQRAYFAAMGGIQEARVRLLTDATVLPTTMPSSLATTGVTYIINPSATTATANITPWTVGSALYDDELCHESFAGLPTSYADANRTKPNFPCTTTDGANGWYTTRASTDPNSGNAGALDYRWVRITLKENRSAAPFYVADPASGAGNNDKRICWDGFKQFPNPGLGSCTNSNYENVYRIASLAMVNNTRRMILAEVAKTPPFVTNAAVDSQDHVTLNGQLTVDGYDFCNCSCSWQTVNKVSTYVCTDRAGKTCDKSKWAIYATGTVDNPNKSETIVAGPNPPIAQNQPWIYDIDSLMNMYKDQAVDVTKAPYNWTCTAATSTSNGACGTHSGVTFGVPPAFPPSPVDTPLPDSSFGSCNTATTPWTGSGCPAPQFTYIPGNAQLTASSNGNGVLIVDGDLDIHGGLQFYGLILVRGVIKFTGGGSDSTNIYGAVLAGQESYVDNTLGGSAVIHFNSCALKQNQQPQPPRVISIRESAY